MTSSEQKPDILREDNDRADRDGTQRKVRQQADNHKGRIKWNQTINL